MQLSSMARSNRLVFMHRSASVYVGFKSSRAARSPAPGWRSTRAQRPAWPAITAARLTARVLVPLPPLAVAKNITAISKQQDAGGDALSSDELATAFSRMSKEEQTLTLIKASHARPIQPPGLATAREMRGE